MADKFRFVPADQAEAENQQEINLLVAAVKKAKNAAQKDNAVAALWEKIVPDVRNGIKSFNCSTEEKKELEQQAYFKLANSAEIWRESGAKFSTYFFMVVKNLFIDRAQNKKRQNDLAHSSAYATHEIGRRSQDTEMALASREVADKIRNYAVAWISNGTLRIEEALALGLRFALGAEFVKNLLVNFKDVDSKIDRLKNIRNIDLNNADLDVEMDETSIADLLGYKSQGAISKIIQRGINKISSILKI